MTGELKIMGRTGHTSVEWSTELRDTVEEANRRFNELLAGGYSAFVMVDDTRGEQMKEFDETAETVILVPRMVGG